MSIVEDWKTGSGCPRRSRSLQPWRYSNLAGHSPDKPVAADPAWSTALEQRLVPASLSYFIIL